MQCSRIRPAAQPGEGRRGCHPGAKIWPSKLTALVHNNSYRNGVVRADQPTTEQAEYCCYDSTRGVWWFTRFRRVPPMRHAASCTGCNTLSSWQDPKLMPCGRTLLISRQWNADEASAGTHNKSEHSADDPYPSRIFCNMVQAWQPARDVLQNNSTDVSWWAMCVQRIKHMLKVHPSKSQHRNAVSSPPHVVRFSVP